MKDWDNDEIVDVQEDKRPWWKDRYIVFNWPAFLGAAAIAALVLAQRLLT
jgi:hypothetical protein